LDKVLQQKSTKKADTNITLAKAFMALNADEMAHVHETPRGVGRGRKSQEDKEKTKQINDMVKSQKRAKIEYECLHVPLFPLCFATQPNRVRRERVLKEKLQLSDTRMDSWYRKKEAYGSLVRTGSIFGTKPKSELSDAYCDLPCYFRVYFCPSHQPINPNVVKKVTSQAKGSSEPHLSSTYKNPTQMTPYILPSNFNVNNSYRISFLEEYWALLGNKKEPKGRTARSRSSWKYEFY
jgi:hypothetical protein